MEFPSTFDQELYSGTCCVIEEPQSQDGVAIIAYSEYKRANIQNPILFTGTFDECDQYREKYTPDNPYYRDISMEEDFHK